MQLMGAVLRNFYEIGSLVNQTDTNDGPYSLKVPHYQRPYKWTSKEIASLIKDWKENIPIQQTGVANTNKYFAGSVVSVAVPNTKFHSLIDGQQRTTTLFLANFVQFVLLRRLILSDIDKKRCAKLQKYNEKLAKTIRYIFIDEKTLSYFDSVVAELNQIADDDAMEELHEQENYLLKYQDLLWIPAFNSKDQYEHDSYKLMLDKLKDSEFYLHYDRSTFNAMLKRVLSQFLIGFGDTTELYATNYINDQLTENEKIYANALKTIINIFKEEFPKDNIKDTYRYIHSLYEKIDTFLLDVNVCVIQTSNTDDAYTLFEVMNDRALALDDLDLIKNQFFKKFVNANNDSLMSQLNDKEIDGIIQKLDEQWGDSIFHHRDMNTVYKKLVTYLATVFLTGSEDLRNEVSEKYRLNISDYLNRQNQYSKEAIQRDFNIFQACFEILKMSKLPSQRKENLSLIAEFNEETNFKRCLYLLNALKQDGVISGLFSYVLSAIEKISTDFNPEVTKKIIRLLLKKDISFEDINKEFGSKMAGDVQVLIEKIQKQSYILWKSSLMGGSAELPREISKKIIKDHFVASTRDNLLGIKDLDLSLHTKEFESWLGKWQYRGNTLFKVKTLFARIIRYSEEENQNLIIRSVRLTVAADAIAEMELDHMVAKHINENSIFSFDHDERDFFVNGLGNMMPLPKKENIQKSNYPLDEAFKYYEDAGLGDHFLITKAKEAVQNVKDGSKEPHKFFTDRKDQLIKYFNQII